MEISDQCGAVELITRSSFANGVELNLNLNLLFVGSESVCVRYQRYLDHLLLPNYYYLGYLVLRT